MRLKLIFFLDVRKEGARVDKDLIRCNFNQIR